MPVLVLIKAEGSHFQKGNLFWPLKQHLLTVADSTKKMRKTKWVFVSGCECNSLFSTATEFFNVWQNGAKTPTFSAVMETNTYM